MPIILEWRHRILHMRASLERNCGQSKFHWIFIGLSFNSRIRNQEGKTSWPQNGKTPEKKEYHLAHNLKKRCIKWKFTGIHDRFLRDHDFRKCMLEHVRDEDAWLKWDDLAEQDFTYRMSESEYVHCRQNWWISLNKSGNTGGPLRKRSDFNQALSALNRLHRESGGQQLRPMPILEVPATATVIEFFLHLVAMEWILVVFLRIQRKSRNMRQAKACEWSGQPVIYRRMALTNLFYFVADISFTADGGLL